MAKVLNLTGFPVNLYAKDGDSCLIQVGESTIQDKFCANIPPKVVIIEKPKAPVSLKKEPAPRKKAEPKKVVELEDEEI